MTNYSPSRIPIPLRPDATATARSSVRSLTHALTASARAIFTPEQDPHKVLARDYPDDHVGALVLKGATSPMSTSATALLERIVPDTLKALGPASAAAALFAKGLELSFGRAASISLPPLVVDSNDAGGFVAEGAPTPIFGLAIGTPVILLPYKCIAGWSLSREMLELGNASAFVENAMRKALSLVLDAAVFGSDAADPSRPAGLLAGVVAGSSSSETDPTNAMLEDVATLIGALSAFGGGVTLVASPARAMMMQARARGGSLPVVLASTAVAAGSLIAVANDTLVSATGNVEVRSSRESLSHMVDANVAEIVTVGGVTAVPVRSHFQTDTVAMKITMDISWTLRAAGVALLNSVTW